jgi:hypothetical protein
MKYENYIRRSDAKQYLHDNPYVVNTPYENKESSMQSLPRQLSFDDVTTSNIYAAIESLQNDVAEIKRSIAETPELLKDVVEQMHEVLAALDELQK